MNLLRNWTGNAWRALLAVSVLLGVVAPAAADDPPPDVRFGAIEAWMAPEAARDLRVGWDRMLVDWHKYQPENADQWTPPPEDQERVNLTVAAGREMVLLLRGTPQWATDGKPYAGVPRGLRLPVDDPRNVWAGFVRRLVREYAGRVNRFIIWNEPDIAPDEYGVQFLGTVEDYYQLVKVAYLAAKQTNPRAQIHLGGLTYWHDVVFKRRPYLQRFLEVASRDPTARANNYYFDVVTVHIYFRTETVYAIITLFRDILRQAGLRHPIWLNETNAAPADDPQMPWHNAMFQLTMDQQAAFLVQAFALGLAAGAERVSVYKLAEIYPPLPGTDYNGLYRPDGSARPAVEAFRTITTHFAGVRRVSHFVNSRYHEVRLERENAVTRVLWARRDQSVLVSLMATRGAQRVVIYDHLGQALPLNFAGALAYTFTLPAAVCRDPRLGCLVGGIPLLAVETLKP